VTFDKAFDNLALVVGDEVIVVGTQKRNDNLRRKAISKTAPRTCPLRKARDNSSEGSVSFNDSFDGQENTTTLSLCIQKVLEGQQVISVHDFKGCEKGG